MKTPYKIQSSYIKALLDKVYLLVETMKIPYSDVMNMPIGRLDDFLDWKAKLEEEREKAMEKIK